MDAQSLEKSSGTKFALTNYVNWRHCPPVFALNWKMKVITKLRNILTIMLAAGVVLAGCSSKEKVSSDSDSTDRSGLVPDSELRGATIYLYEKEKVTTEVHAERLLKFEIKDSTMAYMLDIDFFDSTGQITTELIADSGVIRETTNQLHLYGNVVVVTADRSRLETEYLYWDTNTDKIQTDAFVRITKKDDVITGWGMEADPGLTRIKILNRVSGTVHDDDESNK